VDPNVLWYTSPAGDYHEILPIGNGRLGGAVYGQPAREQIRLNEDTFYTGSPHDTTNPDAHKYLGQIRTEILEQKFEAALATGQKMLGKPVSQQAYQAVGDLFIEFPGHDAFEEYRRELNMAEGIVTVEYSVGGVDYRREIFASYPDQAIVIHLSASEREKLDFSVLLSTIHGHGAQAEAVDDDTLVLNDKNNPCGGVPGKLDVQSRVKVKTRGGRVAEQGDHLTIEGADSATLILAVRTGYINYKDISGVPDLLCRQDIEKAGLKSYRRMKKAHIADFRAPFERVSIDLGHRSRSRIPTDERIAALTYDQFDNLLVAQLFQFGRYLLISSSRPGSQPANLVGIWGEHAGGQAWGGKWTVNINTEMNYWMAESANLAECHLPLFRLIEDIQDKGREVARVHYKCRGVVLHHNTDIWRNAAPVDGAMWGLWPMGNAWLTRHLWEHYDYSRDKEFLRKYWPVFKDAALFYVDYMIEAPDGYLGTCPSISFEQSFEWKDVEKYQGRLCIGPTMDNQIIRDLFDHCISASEILGIEEEFRGQLVELRARLRPTTINPKTGRINEWRDNREKDPHQYLGQMAPLWALNPGDDITPWGTPELAEAAAKTIENRHHDQALIGSWVTGTKMNFWARLGNGEKAWDILKKTVPRELAPSLMMYFYDKQYNQFDGNAGITSGVVEMLMQSHAGVIHLLPALPTDWQEGHVKGLRARGGFVIDIKWKQGRLTTTRIRSLNGNKCRIVYREKAMNLSTKQGRTYTVSF